MFLFLYLLCVSSLISFHPSLHPCSTVIYSFWGCWSLSQPLLGECGDDPGHLCGRCQEITEQKALLLVFAVMPFHVHMHTHLGASI